MEDKELEFVCGENCPHYKKINEVKNVEPNIEEIVSLADMFKLFADNTRQIGRAHV